MAAPGAFAISDGLIGFQEGSTQFCRFLEFDLPQLRVFDAESAFAFLNDTFLIAQEQVLIPKNTSDRKLGEPEAQFMKSFCALAKQLLVDAGLPSFGRETIRTLPVRAGKKNRRVRMTVPVVENVSASIYRMAYEAAFGLILDFAVPTADPALSKPRADALEETLITAIRRACSSGPNCIHLLRAAFEQDVQINHLGHSIYRLGTGSAALLVARSGTDGDSAICARTVIDKWKTLSWLRQIGVPTPRSSLANSFDDARNAAERLKYPVVVKPADRDRSEGVAIDIGDEDELRRAFDNARKWSNRILIEERIPGICHRLVTYRNRFVFAFSRHPKAVVGDGERTVAQLANDAEAARTKTVNYKAGKPFVLDKVARHCLAKQGLQFESVPSSGRIACLRPHNTPTDGGHHETITDMVHPDNIRLAERIARLFRLESMGLDLISTDPSRSWKETGAKITEVNSMPEIGTNSANAYISASFGDNRGAVPVHCYIGGEDAMVAAKAHCDRLRTSGVNAILTSHLHSIDANGDDVVLEGESSLRYRVRVFQSDPLTEALVVVVQTDEILIHGRPMLSVSTIERVNDSLVSFRDPTQSLDPRRIDALVTTIEDGLLLSSGRVGVENVD